MWKIPFENSNFTERGNSFCFLCCQPREENSRGRPPFLPYQSLSAAFMTLTWYMGIPQNAFITAQKKCISFPLAGIVPGEFRQAVLLQELFVELQVLLVVFHQSLRLLLAQAGQDDVVALDEIASEGAPGADEGSPLVKCSLENMKEMTLLPVRDGYQAQQCQPSPSLRLSLMTIIN